MDIESIAKVAVVCSSLTALGSLITTIIACRSSNKIAEAQRQLAQRQIILPLWGYISQLSKFNPEAPVTPDAIKNINALELVALCCEGGMVDEAVITRTFSDQFIQHFEDISICRNIGDGRSGRDLLKENRAAQMFYERLEDDKKTKGKLTNGK